MIALYIYSTLTMAIMLFFGVTDDPDGVIALIAVTLIFVLMYIFAFFHYIQFRKFVNKLTQAELEEFCRCLSYDPALKLWCSGRYLINKSLAVIDAYKVVWIHDQKEDIFIGVIGIPAVVPVFSTTMLIYQYGTVFKPVLPFGAWNKPVFYLSFNKRKGSPRCGQIIRYISRYNSYFLSGYTQENIDLMKKRYNYAKR
jgi:hypothetical protein